MESIDTQIIHGVDFGFDVRTTTYSNHHDVRTNYLRTDFHSEIVHGSGIVLYEQRQATGEQKVDQDIDDNQWDVQLLCSSVPSCVASFRVQ